MRLNWLNLTKIAPIIQWIACALVNNVYPRKSTGSKHTSKSRGNVPLSTHNLFHCYPCFILSGYRCAKTIHCPVCLTVYSQLASNSVRTSAYYLHHGGYVLTPVCLSVCLSVCLPAGSLRKNYGWIFNVAFGYDVGNISAGCLVNVLICDTIGDSADGTTRSILSSVNCLVWHLVSPGDWHILRFYVHRSVICRCCVLSLIAAKFAGV